MGRVKKELLKEKVWIRCVTVREFDCSWGVYLQDPDDLPDGWIDVIYEAVDDTERGKKECEDWVASQEGLELIPDPFS